MYTSTIESLAAEPATEIPDTLPSAFANAVAAWPHSTLTGYRGVDIAETVSLREFQQKALQFARGLQNSGIHAGDVVAVQLPNWIEAAVTHAACALLGAVTLPIVHNMGKHELGFILRQSGAQIIITTGWWRGSDRCAELSSIGPIPNLRARIAIGESTDKQAIEWISLLDNHALDSVAVPQADHLALIIYTSGTTAAPKGVCHSHRSLLANIFAIQATAEDVALTAWPPGHIAGFNVLSRFWLCGNKTVAMDVWNSMNAVRLIARHGVTTTSGTAFHLKSMLSAARTEHVDISTLVNYMAGASAIPSGLLERCAEIGVDSYRAYGLTEAPHVSVGSDADGTARRMHTDGKVRGNVEVSIVDSHGAMVLPGTDGEIFVRQRDHFLGYVDDSLNTQQVRQGWVATGDIGRVDHDGYITITDRKKDIIVRAGQKIAPRELDEVLNSMAEIQEGAITSVEDDLAGEKIWAVVIVQPQAKLQLADIADHFRKSGLSHYKIPDKLLIVDDLPRTATGKLRRAELRNLILTQQSDPPSV